MLSFWTVLGLTINPIADNLDSRNKFTRAIG